MKKCRRCRGNGEWGTLPTSRQSTSPLTRVLQFLNGIQERIDFQCPLYGIAVFQKYHEVIESPWMIMFLLWECENVEVLPIPMLPIPNWELALVLATFSHWQHFPHPHFLSSTLNGTSLWWFMTFSFPAHFNIGMSGVPFVGVPEVFRQANKGSASIAAAIAATATRKHVMPIFRLISPHMSSPPSQSRRITRSCAFQN